MPKLWTFGDSFTAGHGCAFELSGTFVNTNIENYYTKTYKNYIDVNKKIWPQLVSDFFNLDLNNFGINGLSNESIADSVLSNIINLDKDDIVILQTSTVGRYDFPFPNKKTLFGFSNKNTNEKDYKIYNINNSSYFFKTIFVSNIEKEWDISMKDVLQYTNGQENLNNKELTLNEYKYNLIRGFFAEFINTQKYYERAIWRIVEISKLLLSLGIKNYILNEVRWPENLSKPFNLIEMHPNGMTGYIGLNKQTITYDTNNKIEDGHPSYIGHESIANFIINFIKNENTNIYYT
jgi:hypothetical protein